MTRARRVAVLLVWLAIALVVAACGGAKPSAPPGEVPAPEKPSPTDPAGAQTVAVYFSDWQAQHLIPEERQVPEGEGAALAERVVKEVLAGPTDPHLHRTIPASVKLVEPVTVQDGVAHVNLSKEFLSVRGATGVRMALGSLVQSLTDLPGIRQVLVLVNGQTGIMMDEGVTLEPMGRGFYGEDRLFPDRERAQYLNEQVQNGRDAWREDAAKTLLWEGRMFGFTAAELSNAAVAVTGDQAEAKVARGGKRYVVKLAKQGRVWLITEIAS